MRNVFLFLIASIALPLPAQAAQVVGLQTPAWLKRDGQPLPLRPDTTLKESDVVETGRGGRLFIQLADGSIVKLGENARLAIESLKENEAQGNALTALFNVAQGAFRYTASTLGRAFKRDIEMRVVTTTIGIRGTDVWGKSRDGSATVCLLEGRITLTHPARGEFVLDQPLSFFVAPRDGEPHPVALADPGKLVRWSAETELDLGHGVLLPGGGWIVQLGSHASEASARTTERQLLDAGIPVELTTVQLKDRTFYRLRVSGFDTQRDAKFFADRVKGRPGIPKPWVTCEIPGRSCQ
jgi:hypothetical protein